jgi:hypothetical protein
LYHDTSWCHKNSDTVSMLSKAVSMHILCGARMRDYTVVITASCFSLCYLFLFCCANSCVLCQVRYVMVIATVLIQHSMLLLLLLNNTPAVCSANSVMITTRVLIATLVQLTVVSAHTKQPLSCKQLVTF